MLPRLLDMPPVPGETLSLYDIYAHHKGEIVRRLEAGILPAPAGDFEFVFDHGELTSKGSTPADRFTNYYANRQVPLAPPFEHDAGHVQDNRDALSIPEFGDMIQRAAQRSSHHIDTCREFAKATDKLGDEIYDLRTGWATDDTLASAREALSTLVGLAEPDPRSAATLLRSLDLRLGFRQIEWYANPHIAALGHLAAGKPNALSTAYDLRVRQAALFLARGIIPPLYSGQGFIVNHPDANIPSGLTEPNAQGINISYPKPKDIQLIPAYQWLFTSYDLAGVMGHVVRNTGGEDSEGVEASKLTYFHSLFQSLSENARLLLSGVSPRPAAVTTMRNILGEMVGKAQATGYHYRADRVQIEDHFMLKQFEQYK